MARKTKNLTTAISAIKLKPALTAIVITLIVLILGLLKNQFIVATVNGKQITRIALIKELEKKDGKGVLDSMITEQLILQEVQKRNVKIAEQETNQEISKIEESIKSQGQNLDDLLAAQNFSRAQLKRQIEIQLALKKIVGDVKVTDQEIDDYIEQNKDSIPAGTKPEELRSQAKGQLEQQKLNDKIQSFIEELRKKAKIEYFLKI